MFFRHVHASEIRSPLWWIRRNIESPARVRIYFMLAVLAMMGRDPSWVGVTFSHFFRSR